MSNINTTIKRLVKQGKQVEFTLKVTPFDNYYVSDTEIEKLLAAFPEYKRAGLKSFKFNNASVFLPYYLTKGFFTSNKESLLPIKITPTV